jgi:hypothetical protein
MEGVIEEGADAPEKDEEGASFDSGIIKCSVANGALCAKFWLYLIRRLMDRRICHYFLQGHGRSIIINEGFVGHARAAAACATLRSYRGRLEKCWLANTDADCVVPGDGVARQISVCE